MRSFAWRAVVAVMAALSTGLAAAAGPNVVVILADDLGFSDLGCYGSEIDTPHLDRLAAGGLRFTQGYNTARCWPSRASILTGYYPQAIRRDALPGGNGGTKGERPTWARLLPELLAPAGYRSYHSGKWHVDGDPRKQGFDRSLQIEGGQNDYFDPAGITVDGRPIGDRDGFYITTVVGEHAAACLRDHAATHPGNPFFSYVAFTSPHFPLHAPQDLVAKYRARYAAGWDAVQQARVGRIRSMGLVTSPPAAMERDIGPPYRHASALALLGGGEVDRPLPWNGLTDEQRDFQITKMAIHAAMIDAMDQAVGKIVAQLEAMAALDDTLILFASDNGASAEIMVRGKGHDPKLPAGGPGTYLCLGPGWSSCANTPFRRHKTWVHEGGVATPWIVHWPKGIATKGGLRTQPVHVVDVAPTVLALAGIEAPAEHDGGKVSPMQGRSFAAALRDASVAGREGPLWWCHEGHRAVRVGDWKLVAAKGTPWELYDLSSDRCETKDLASAEPARVESLEAVWNRIADECRGLAGSGGGRDAQATSRKRPNIVFFLCDDLGGGDIAALGSKHIRTPSIDALFARGTRLSRHWAGCAVCAPSRCVLMTGKHPGHAVVRSNREVKPEGQAPMPAGTVTLARLLKDAGYATGGFGKWGLGAPGSVSEPIACGFDEFFGYNCQRQAHSFYPDHLWNGRERIDLDGKTYSADLIAERQLAFIRSHAADPFFLYVPTTVPHLALQVPDDEPSLAEYVKHFGDEEPYLGGRGYQPCRRPLATYAAMITRMDREVGRIVKLLEELKLADDTIFVFSSDNGATWPGIGGGDTARLESNGPLRDWKGSPYEGGLRVPTVAVWPGRIPAGKMIDSPSGFEDWLPTLLDLAGLHDRIPSGLDGVSLAGALRGEAVAAQDRVLYRELTESLWQAAVNGRWKAIRKAVSRKEPGTSLPTELYDLAADPSESRNVASEQPGVVARLEAILDREHVPDPAWPLPFADVGGQSKKAAAAKPEAKRPNILYIIVDDQSPFDFRFYNPASTLQSPVIERLAAEGMILDAAYHMGSFSGAVCVPSRHMLMCGRSVWHLPMNGGDRRRAEATPIPIRCPPDIAAHTLGAVFNRAGYDTMRTCKKENCYPAADELFTIREIATKRGDVVQTGSGWHADRVLAYLDARRASGDGDPFLIHLGFSHPHDTRDGTAELLAKYGATNHTDEATSPPADPRQPPLPPNWLPRHPFDNTDMRVRDEVSVSGVWGRRDEATVRNEIGREYACSENIDRQIGRVLDKLEAMGELDNTWIFYTADHGIAIGRHGLQGKQNLYEHTWRVPFIVKGPGVRSGSRVSGNIYLGDSLATLCDIAGIAAPETDEGKSFLPVLEGRCEAVRDVLYGVYCGGAKPGMRSVRKGAWKLIKYESPKAGPHTQLFNLMQNPHELLAEHHDPAVAARLPAPPTIGQRNLGDDPAHAAKRTEMESLLLAEMRRHDDPFRFSDQPGRPDSPDQTARPARVPEEASR